MSRYQPIIPKINNPEVKLPDQLVEEFMLALKSGSLTEVEKLIRSTNLRANLRDYIGRDPSRKTPYHIVLELDDNIANADRKYAMIKLLDKIGSPIDLPDSNNVWPIHLAAKTNDERIIKFFVDKSVDINRTDSSGNTPLQYALFGSEIDCPADNFPKPLIPDKPAEAKEYNTIAQEITKEITKEIITNYSVTITDISSALMSIESNDIITKKYTELVQNQLINILSDPKLKDSVREQQNKIEELITRVFADLRSDIISVSSTPAEHRVVNSKYTYQLNNLDITSIDKIIQGQQRKLFDMKNKIFSITTDSTDKEYYRIEQSTEFHAEQIKNLSELVKSTMSVDSVKKYLFMKYFILLTTYYYIKFPVDVYSQIVLDNMSILTSDEFNRYIKYDKRNNFYNLDTATLYANGNKSMFSIESIEMFDNVLSNGYHNDLYSDRVRQSQQLIIELSMTGANQLGNRLLTKDVEFLNATMRTIGTEIPILATDINKISNQRETFADVFRRIVNDIVDSRGNLVFIDLYYNRQQNNSCYLSLLVNLHRMTKTSILGVTPPKDSYPKILSYPLSKIYQAIDTEYDINRYMGIQSNQNYLTCIVLMKIIIQYLIINVRQNLTQYFTETFNKYTSYKNNANMRLETIYHLYNDSNENNILDFALSTSMLLDVDISNADFESNPTYKLLDGKITDSNPLIKFLSNLESTNKTQRIYSEIETPIAKYFMKSFRGVKQNRKYAELNTWIDDIIVNNFTEAEIDEIYSKAKTTELFAHIDSIITNATKLMISIPYDKGAFDMRFIQLNQLDRSRESIKGAVIYSNLVSSLKYYSHLTLISNTYVTALKQIIADIYKHVEKNYNYNILESFIPSFTIYSIRYVKELLNQLSEFDSMRNYNNILDVKNNIIKISTNAIDYIRVFYTKVISSGNIYLAKLITYLNLSSAMGYIERQIYPSNPLDQVGNTFSKYIEDIIIPFVNYDNPDMVQKSINEFLAECNIVDYEYYTSPLTYQNYIQFAQPIYANPIYANIGIILINPAVASNGIDGQVITANLTRDIGHIATNPATYNRSDADEKYLPSVYNNIDTRLLIIKSYLINKITANVNKFDANLNKLFATDTFNIKDLPEAKKVFIGRIADGVINQILINLFTRAVGQLVKSLARSNSNIDYANFTALFKDMTVFKFKLTDIITEVSDIPPELKNKYISGYSTVIINPQKEKIKKEFIQYLYDGDFNGEYNQSNRKKCIYVNHDIIEMLLTQINASKLDSNGNNILHYLVANHNSDLIKKITSGNMRIEPNYLLSSKNVRGQTPIKLATDNLLNHLNFISGDSFKDRYAMLIEPFNEILMSRLRNDKYGGNILRNTDLVIPFINLVYHHMYYNYLAGFNYGSTFKQKNLIDQNSAGSYDFYNELYDQSAVATIITDKNPSNIIKSDAKIISDPKLKELNNKLNILTNMVRQLQLGLGQEADANLQSMYTAIINKHNTEISVIQSEISNINQRINTQPPSNISNFQRRLSDLIEPIKSDPNKRFDLLQIYKVIFDRYDSRNNSVINADVVKSAINNESFTSSIDICIQYMQNNINNTANISVIAEYLKTIVDRINLKYELKQMINENPIIKEEYDILAFVLDKLLTTIVYEYLMQAFYKNLQIQSDATINLSDIFEETNTIKIDGLTIKEFITKLSKIYIRYTAHIYESNADPLQNTVAESDIYKTIVDYFRLNTKYNFIDSSPFVKDLVAIHLPFIGDTYRNVINSAMSSIYANERYLTSLYTYVGDYVALFNANT